MLLFYIYRLRLQNYNAFVIYSKEKLKVPMRNDLWSSCTSRGNDSNSKEKNNKINVAKKLMGCSSCCGCRRWLVGRNSRT